MPTNIEIKSRVREPERMRERAEALSDSAVEVLKQTDTFFRSASGRLKLRQEGPGRGVLIFYDRPDEAGPRASRYEMAETGDPDALRSVLSRVLGVLGIVRKTRELYRRGPTRIHLDEVEGLGTFLELEVVLGPDDSPARGRAVAEELMERLGIGPDDLVDRAYLDLLRETGASGAISRLC